MAQRRPRQVTSLSVRGNQPLIGVILQEGGEEIVRYFVDEQAVDMASPEASIQRALHLAGAWSDLDWDDMLATLDRIRHESQPTPPMIGL